MADKATVAGQNVGGLAGLMDISNIPLSGKTEDQIKQLTDAQEGLISSLEQRYKEPNLYKVAAGFLKPQLGGFAASLGSASEAMGENFELNRAQQLPIAEMRARVAQSNLLLGDNKKATAYVNSLSGPPTAKDVAYLKALAPNSPATIALEQQYKQDQERTGLVLNAYQTAIRPGFDLPAGLKAQVPELGAVGAEEEGGKPPPGGPSAPANQPGQPTVAPSAVAEPKTPSKPKPIDVKDLITVEDAPGATGPVRMTKDVFDATQKAGINVISQYRDQKEHEALRHHQDEKGNWFTSTNRPWAPNSKHLTADAIDINPSQKLTDEQEKTLSNLGFKRVDPRDKNHFERPAGYAAPEKPKEPTPLSLDPSKNKDRPFEDYGIPVIPKKELSNEISVKNYQNKELRAIEDIKPIIDLGREQVNQVFVAPIDSFLNYYGDTKNTVMINNKPVTHKQLVDSIVMEMKSNPALVNAFLAAGQQGLQVSILGQTVSGGLPFKTFLENLHPTAGLEAAGLLQLALGSTNIANHKIKGVGFGAGVPASSADLSVATNLTRDFSPPVLIHEMSTTENTLRKYRDQYRAYQDIDRRFHDKGLSNVAPTWQIYNSAHFGTIADRYNAQQKRIDEARDRSMGGSR
jgi:hypothetical protein